MVQVNKSESQANESPESTINFSIPLEYTLSRNCSRDFVYNSKIYRQQMIVNLVL